MTVLDITQILMDAGIENAREEALLLVSILFDKSRSALLCDPSADFDSEGLRDAVDRRCRREPLQYIIGQWYFRNEVYRVNEHCLIPRPDTECLVDYALKSLPTGGVFADLCTGSGCIAVSTLAARPDLSAVGVDLFPETLALAAENAERNGVADRFFPLIGDVLADPDPSLAEKGPFDAILSNPPYIRSAVVDALEPELFFEPRAALDGGADGLMFYRSLVSRYLPLLKADGFFLLEIGYDQAEDIAAIAAAHALTAHIQNDLSGLPRLAVLTRPARR